MQAVRQGSENQCSKATSWTDLSGYLRDLNQINMTIYNYSFNK